MKKLSVVCFLIIISSSLFGQSFSSNILGQNLGLLREDSKYVLDVEGNTETLFEEGELIRTKTVENNPENNKTTITVSYPEGKSEISVYEGPKLILQEYITEELKQSYAYTYQDNRLLFVTYSENDEVKSVDYYLKSANDGSLIGIMRYSDTSLIGETYLYEEKEMYSELSEGFVVSGDFSFTDDGLVEYEKDGIKKTYSSSGLLLKEETENYSKEYSYDKGILISSKLIEGNSTSESVYSEGKLFSETEYTDNQISQFTLYRPEGMIRTMYSNGRKVADIHYKSDNRKVKEIQYY